MFVRLIRKVGENKWRAHMGNRSVAAWAVVVIIDWREKLQRLSKGCRVISMDGPALEWYVPSHTSIGRIGQGCGIVEEKSISKVLRFEIKCCCCKSLSLQSIPRILSLELLLESEIQGAARGQVETTTNLRLGWLLPVLLLLILLRAASRVSACRSCFTTML